MLPTDLMRISSSRSVACWAGVDEKALAEGVAARRLVPAERENSIDMALDDGLLGALVGRIRPPSTFFFEMVSFYL